MKATEISRLAALSLLVPVFAAPMACGAAGTSDPGAKIDTPTGATLAEAILKESFQFAASEGTTQATGVVTWKGGLGADGVLELDGLDEANAVVAKITSTTQGAEEGFTLTFSNGAAESANEAGSLTYRNGAVVSNTLPLVAGTVGRQFQADYAVEATKPHDELSWGCGLTAAAALGTSISATAECVVGGIITVGLSCVGALVQYSAAAGAVAYYCANCGGSCSSQQTCDGLGDCNGSYG